MERIGIELERLSCQPVLQLPWNNVHYIPIRVVQPEAHLRWAMPSSDVLQLHSIPAVLGDGAEGKGTNLPRGNSLHTLSVFERVWEGGESPSKCWIVSLCFSSGTTVGHVLTWICPYFIVGICTYKLCIRKWGFVHMCFQAEDLFFNSGKFSAMLIIFHVLNSILWKSCIHADAWI